MRLCLTAEAPEASGVGRIGPVELLHEGGVRLLPVERSIGVDEVLALADVPPRDAPFVVERPVASASPSTTARQSTSSRFRSCSSGRTAFERRDT
jgi:hypothetical protein